MHSVIIDGKEYIEKSELPEVKPRALRVGDVVEVVHALGSSWPVGTRGVIVVISGQYAGIAFTVKAAWGHTLDDQTPLGYGYWVDRDSLASGDFTVRRVE